MDNENEIICTHCYVEFEGSGKSAKARRWHATPYGTWICAQCWAKSQAAMQELSELGQAEGGYDHE